MSTYRLHCSCWNRPCLGPSHRPGAALRPRRATGCSHRHPPPPAPEPGCHLLPPTSVSRAPGRALGTGTVDPMSYRAGVPRPKLWPQRGGRPAWLWPCSTWPLSPAPEPPGTCGAPPQWPSPPSTPPAQQWPRSPSYLGLGSSGSHCHGCKQTSEAALKLTLTSALARSLLHPPPLSPAGTPGLSGRTVIGGGAWGKSQDSVHTHGPCLALQSAILLCCKQ